MSKYMEFFKKKMAEHYGDLKQNDSEDEDLGEFEPSDSSGEPGGDDYDDDFAMMAHGGSVDKKGYEDAPHMNQGGVLPILMALLAKGGKVPGGTEAGHSDASREPKQFQGKPSFPQAPRQRMANGGMMKHQAFAQALKKRRG